MNLRQDHLVVEAFELGEERVNERECRPVRARIELKANQARLERLLEEDSLLSLRPRNVVLQDCDLSLLAVRYWVEIVE
jgi:hypothetical protein